LLSVHQTTFGPGDAQHPSTGSRAKLIAYDAKPNGVGSRQIMVAPRLGGIPYAVTNGAADSINPVVDDGGRFVVFESQADLLGAGFGGSQIYLADLRIADPTCPYPCAATGNAGLRQITQKTGTSTHAVVSKGGRVVAFESDADLLSQGETETQIYRVDTSFGSTARVTKGPGASRHATLSKNGKTLAFESDANLLGAGSGGTQIFLFKKDATLQQVTNAQGALSTAPSLELTGRGILFRSTADLLHNNTTDPQVYEYDIASGAFRQVTDTSGTIRDPMYSAGVFTIFVANDDLLGNGSSGEQLYLVNLFALQNANVP
jgi:Tol biopolymer transport system component